MVKKAVPMVEVKQVGTVGAVQVEAASVGAAAEARVEVDSVETRAAAVPGTATATEAKGATVVVRMVAAAVVAATVVLEVEGRAEGWMVVAAMKVEVELLAEAEMVAIREGSREGEARVAVTMEGAAMAGMMEEVAMVREVLLVAGAMERRRR